ncbi:MAG: coproporphyrinogen dehydrogenase HemZ [Lachnospiraceae bacterium]|nr:coproporphyrinogen dehydrogenase HemZ [Lachnospiraceae bacterium]
MILLKTNVSDYDNDICSMLMAFFFGEKIVNSDEAAEKIAKHKADYNFNTELLLELNAYFDIEKTNIIISETTTAKKYETQISGDYRDRNVYRNSFKIALYRLLSEITGRKLPWGDLTGVRPTKIALKLLRSGSSYDDTIDNYIKTYDVSRRKAELATQVATRELELIKYLDLENSYCLYVGIPFCPSRCLYCSFTSYPIAQNKDKVDKYLDRLCDEISIVADRYRDKKLVAIYIGGGTPTSLNHIQLDRLLTHIDEVFSLGDKIDKSCIKGEDIDKTVGTSYDKDNWLHNLLEYTIEAGRPDSITKEKLEVMKSHHITRISINPQTMNDETLKTIGRAHTATQVEKAFFLARELGFDNINMDIIAGLVGEDLSMMEHTLDAIKKLKPDSLTIHSLAIKRAARLNEKMDEYKGEINHDMNEMLDMVSDAANNLGMSPYYLYRQKNIGGNLENVGYSSSGKECLYNVLIMEELTDIIAVGAGSSSKYVIRDDEGNVIRIDRSENCKSIDDYIDRFDEMIGRKR